MEWLISYHKLTVKQYSPKRGGRRSISRQWTFTLGLPMDHKFFSKNYKNWRPNKKQQATAADVTIDTDKCGKNRLLLMSYRSNECIFLFNKGSGVVDRIPQANSHQVMSPKIGGRKQDLHPEDEPSPWVCPRIASSSVKIRGLTKTSRRLQLVWP